MVKGGFGDSRCCADICRFSPQRALYVAIGHDEEVGGAHGATKIVEHLKRQGVELELVLDEGGVVIEDGMPPLTSTPIAVVGTAEKVPSQTAACRFHFAVWTLYSLCGAVLPSGMQQAVIVQHQYRAQP